MFVRNGQRLGSLIASDESASKKAGPKTEAQDSEVDKGESPESVEEVKAEVKSPAKGDTKK